MISTEQLTRLVEAQSIYNSFDYKEVTAPWEVDVDAIDLTKPDDVQYPHAHLYCTDKALVGSAEQSFLGMRLKGMLPDGKYSSITPCFRNEPLSEIHRHIFMKLELINIAEEEFHLEDVQVMVDHAISVFEHLGLVVEVVETDEATYSYDIVCAETGIELGSYGMRHHPSVGFWIYGTGLAEPRYTIVKGKVS